jgi:hypothetical protein
MRLCRPSTTISVCGGSWAATIRSTLHITVVLKSAHTPSEPRAPYPCISTVIPIVEAVSFGTGNHRLDPVPEHTSASERSMCMLFRLCVDVMCAERCNEAWKLEILVLQRDLHEFAMLQA